MANSAEADAVLSAVAVNVVTAIVGTASKRSVEERVAAAVGTRSSQDCESDEGTAEENIEDDGSESEE